MRNSFGIPYGFNRERDTFHVYDDDRHLLTFGPTRSGKGSTVIVQALLRVPHSVICIDPKGQNAAITARQRCALQGADNVFCLNPFGLHTEAPWNLPKHRFNPLAHLSIASDNVVADVGGLAEALIITTQGENPFFSDAARDLVKAILLHLIAENKATLPEMRRRLTLPRHVKPEEDKFLIETLEPMSKSPVAFVRQTAPRFFLHDRTVASVLAVAATQTGFLDDPAIAATLSGNDFTMRQLKQTQTPGTVFLILPGRYMEAYARFFRLIVTSAVDQLTSEPGGHPVLLLLDEFATLQNLAAISKAFGFAAGFNLQCWAFLQDLPQLKAIYDDKWESFIANAGLLQFFTPADMTTARYLQDRGGEKTVETRGKQISPWLGIPRGVSVNPTREPQLRPEKTMSMEGHQQIVFFGGTHSPHEVERRDYWKIERLRGLWDRDPYQPV